MKVILDMDTGVDDAVALILALNAPELEILAVTTVAGNAPVECCTRNSLLVVELLGGDVPVAQGAAAPLKRPLTTAPEVHGPDGLGGAPDSLPEPVLSPSSEPASALLSRLPMEHPGDITLVTTGPLTNVAAALEENPGLAATLKGIVAMGGAFDVPGNTGPVAEFNIYVDPEAAAAVLGSGLDVTLVPLDATTGATLARRRLESHVTARGPARERPGRDLAAILYRALDYYMNFQLWESGLEGGYMHDPLAVAAVFEPSILTTAELTVDVAMNGRDRGRTTSGPAQEGRPVRVASGLDEARFALLLEQRVLDPVFGRL